MAGHDVFYEIINRWIFFFHVV